MVVHDTYVPLTSEVVHLLGVLVPRNTFATHVLVFGVELHTSFSLSLVYYTMPQVFVVVAVPAVDEDNTHATTCFSFPIASCVL